mgnify:CR=1 FL=1
MRVAIVNLGPILSGDLTAPFVEGDTLVLTNGLIEFAGSASNDVIAAATDVIAPIAQARGVAVTAEVTPHHLLLTDEACSSFDPATKFRPPLRTAEDRAAIVAAVAMKPATRKADTARR